MTTKKSLALLPTPELTSNQSAASEGPEHYQTTHQEAPHTTRSPEGTAFDSGESSGVDSSGVRARRSLSLAEPSALRRHPKDGFQRARPWPMGPRTLRAFRSIILAMCPENADAPSGPAISRYVETSVRLWLSYVPRWLARALCLCLYLLEWSPLWSGAAWTRLSRLSAPQRARVLGRLGRSRLYLVRRLVLTWSSLCLSAYFDHPEVHRRLDYAPVPFMRSRIALRQSLLAPASSHS